MKKALTILVPVLALWTRRTRRTAARLPRSSVGVPTTSPRNQNQNVSANGGESRSDSASNANVNMNTTSISNYQTRTPPLTTFPPYLPYWNHGGWGTIKAYFPNGPTANDQIYETTFDPQNPSDMRELRSVLQALPHTRRAGGGRRPCSTAWRVALFGKPDTYFHGRGIEIADSIVRDRRPEGKSLLVFIDSNVDMNLLGEEGYAYMGKVSVEGDPERNWDQAYKAAVAEALLWDVDILLVSGGMKGVTTGTNITFPSAARRLQPGQLLAVAARRQGHGHHRGQGQGDPQRRGLPVLPADGRATENPGRRLRPYPGPALADPRRRSGLRAGCASGRRTHLSGSSRAGR